MFCVLGGGGLAVPVVGAYTWKIGPHRLEIVEREMAIRHLPEHLVGKKLVQLSDLHIGAQVEDGYMGWILAGHTHGGQCKPPFLPPPLLPVRNRRYVAGEYPLAGSRSLYVSRGVGHLIQVRFNVRPEITLFQMTRA
ncbi:MAG: hypothetical protein NTW21_42740 [Verrucomicrobia bacterium]|nr:hypothetical protein [Verrucomicrobiota bacterium]